jgi:hypothetical protein
MKKFILVLLIGFLFITNSLLSQTLERTLWQLQNPDSPCSSESLFFDYNYKCTYMVLNLATQQHATMNGTYSLSDDILTLNFPRKTFNFTLIKIRTNLINLYFNGSTMIFATCSSNEDHFMDKCLQSTNNNSYTPSNTYQQPKQETCYTCHGTGTCVVCRGSGRTSYYGGDSKTCTGCGGDGKCWHCHGSRLQ